MDHARRHPSSRRRLRRLVLAGSIAVSVCALLVGGLAERPLAAATDAERLQAGVLESADLPPGWASLPDARPADFRADFTAAAKKIAVCRPFARFFVADLTTASSAEFVGGASTAHNDVTLYPNSSGPLALLGQYLGVKRTAKCFEELVPVLARARLEKDGVLGPPGRIRSVTATSVEAIPPLAEPDLSTGYAGYRVGLRVRKKGGDAVNIVYDDVVTRADRVVAHYSFTSADPANDETRNDAVLRSMGRVIQAFDVERQPKETEALAKVLVPVPGYRYTNPPPEVAQDDAGHAESDDAAWLTGNLSRHRVWGPRGVNVGDLLLIEYNPEYVSQPGWAFDELVYDAQDFSGQQEVLVVEFPNTDTQVVVGMRSPQPGYYNVGTFWFEGNVLAVVLSTDAAEAAKFAQAFIEQVALASHTP